MLHQSNSGELNLTKARPTFEEESHFETPAGVDFPRIKEEVQVTTSSVCLVLILAEQGGQGTSDPPGDRCFTNSYRHSEIHADEDDFDHTFSSKCSLVMSTEDIKLKAEKSFDDNNLVTCISTEEQFPSRKNITRTIDPTTNNSLPNTHHQHNYVMLSESLSAPCKISAIHDQVNGEYNYDKQYVQENSMDTHNMEVAYTKNCQELFKSEGSTNMPFSITNTSSSNYENIQQLVQETIERSIDKSSTNMQFPITNKSSYDYETIQQLSPENIKRSVDESIVNTPFTITNTSFSNNENVQLLAQENTEGSFDEPPMNIFNSHHMSLSGVNVDIESNSGPDATKDHKKLHRSKNPKIFTCEECHKQFSRHSGLRIHLLIHKGEKPYKCEDCGKYFRDRTSLRRHRQRIHHDAINNYVCPNCNKVYFERSVFLKHMEKESGTKRFHCKECNKSYTEMSSYRRHARLHGGKKPFKCDLCNRRFTAICNVRQHMLTQHSSVLPFQCPECDKSFPRKYLFKKHVEEHSSKISQSNSTLLNLLEAVPIHEEANCYKTPTEHDFHKIKEEAQGKTTPSSPEQDSNLNLPILSSLSQHETSALTNYTNEAGTESRFVARVGTFGLMLFVIVWGWAGQLRVSQDVSEISKDEDDFDNTVPSECSLVVSTEDIQLKTETNFDDDDDSVTFISTEEQFPSIENTTRTIDSTTNHLLSNTHPQHNYIGLSELLAAPCKIPAIHDQVDGEYNYDKQYVRASYTDTPGMDVSYTRSSQELFMHKGSINTPFSMSNTSYSNYENIQQLAQEKTERSLDESLVNMSSHQMNLNVVHNHIENDSRSATTNMSKTKDKPIKPKIFICEECHRQFSRLSGLKTHLLIHKGEKPCKCKDCGRNFRDKTILRRHRQRIHHDTTVSYKCPNCDKIFFEKSYLLRHLQNESGEKRFHCKECNKGYTEMSSYKRHVRLHGGNKPFKCDLCNKRFTAIGNVRQHKLTQHSRIYPFKCPECAIRVLPHGNTDAERGFSQTSNYLTDNRTCLSEASIRGMQVTKDRLIHYNYQSSTVSFTKNFIEKGRGIHKLYLAGLEEEVLGWTRRRELRLNRINKSKKIKEKIKNQSEEYQPYRKVVENKLIECSDDNNKQWDYSREQIKLDNKQWDYSREQIKLDNKQPYGYYTMFNLVHVDGQPKSCSRAIDLPSLSYTVITIHEPPQAMRLCACAHRRVGGEEGRTARYREHCCSRSAGSGVMVEGSPEVPGSIPSASNSVYEAVGLKRNQNQPREDK
uniref:C2H2-type domain-containing protein n=1 Tax=Timema douglasi TaxID=61478 RepID=A0A7R8VAJ8_TIMDO|nr:unnamed protein product [Timema douglasi]